MVRNVAIPGTHLLTIYAAVFIQACPSRALGIPAAHPKAGIQPPTPFAGENVLASGRATGIMERWVKAEVIASP